MNKKLSMSKASLAIHGGKPVRKTIMPPRLAMGVKEEKSISEVFEFYKKLNQDPGYQGYFEKKYCDAFVKMMGGGYADAVATGTAAIYIALAALNIPKGSDILVSPITDPGTLSPIILLGYKPKLVDSGINSYNITANNILKRIDENTKALIVVHAAGNPCDMDEISKICLDKNIKLIEDCSQAHGAKVNNQPIGSFGDIAAFSTMYSKNSIAGPTGGVVFTRDINLYQNALAHADRGKPTWLDDYDPKDPSQFLFPALNLHTDEFSCAIGIQSIKKLPDTIRKRQKYYKMVSNMLQEKSYVCTTYEYSDNSSPFIIPVFVKQEAIKCSKYHFANAVRSEGIDLNPHYKYLVQEWPWVKEFLADDYFCENASESINSSFCLYVNEKYSEKEVSDTIDSILKVENYYV